MLISTFKFVRNDKIFNAKLKYKNLFYLNVKGFFINEYQEDHKRSK